MADIKSKVIEIVRDQLGIPEREEIKEEHSFVEDLDADSLDEVELVMYFEQEFNLAIPDEVAEEIDTVGKAIAALSSPEFIEKYGE